MKAAIEEQVELPQGVSASLDNKFLVIKGPKGELKKHFESPKLTLNVEPGKIKLACSCATKREKRMIYTFLSHIKNMIEGVQKPFIYKLKVCSSHFPMSVSVTGSNFQVKNFLGEKSPRTLKLKQGVTIKIAGDVITVESPDKELAGQVASDIELLTAKRDRDLRRFQDGIYIIEKAGEPVET